VKSRIFSKGEILEDRYKIEKELSRGGMSIVYVSTDLETGKFVVLKQPKPDSETKQTLYCDSIRYEANILSRLNHPNIVKYIDFLHKPSILVEEYIEGASLSELYCGECASEKDALNIAIKLCEVLSYLHEQGVVHRDICPRNILIDTKGIPHVIDFGTAYDLKQNTCVAANVQHGPYSCPEMAEKMITVDPHIIHAADTFSFGATLYALLSTSSPPPLTDGKNSLNLRSDNLFKNVVVRLTNKDPYLRDHLDNVLQLLRDIEDNIRYKPMLKIVKSNDPNLKTGTLYFLDKNTSKIGFTPQCEINLPVRFITSVHAEIHNKGTDWFISDSNSQNGTFLNETKLIPRDRLLLHDSDKIWLVYNPEKPKEPYIQIEFIRDRKRIEGYYKEINDLDIKTSWDWDGNSIKMNISVQNNSKHQWNNILVDFSSLKDYFKTDEDLLFSFNLEPEKERYYRKTLELADSSMGGDFMFPMRVQIGGRTIREENIHVRYGENFKPSTGLNVAAEKRLDGEKLHVQLKLHNVSPYTYNRVCVGLNIPDDLELIDPETTMCTIPVLASNEEFPIHYVLKPRRKMKTTIHFELSYMDHLGKKQKVDVRGIDSGEILPLIEPLEMSENLFLEEISKLYRTSRQTMYKDVTLSKAKKKIYDVCGNLFKVSEHRENDNFQILYSGKPAKSKSKILFSCGAWEKEADLVEFRFDAYTEDMELADEFLQEQFGSIDRAFRVDKALQVTQVTYNTTIKDSVVFKSKLTGEKNVEDSLAYKTD
jgi:serine/threonine protein kinase